VVDGLDARSTGGRIVISPGMALDPMGDEIVLTASTELLPPSGAKGCRALYVVVRYAEWFTDPVPGGETVEFSRVTEGAQLDLSDALPRGHDGAVAVARLLWRTSQWRVDPRFRRRKVRR
jgi:hypothetical protein